MGIVTFFVWVIHRFTDVFSFLWIGAAFVSFEQVMIYYAIFINISQVKFVKSESRICADLADCADFGFSVYPTILVVCWVSLRPIEM